MPRTQLTAASWVLLEISQVARILIAALTCVCVNWVWAYQEGVVWPTIHLRRGKRADSNPPSSCHPIYPQGPSASLHFLLIARSHWAVRELASPLSGCSLVLSTSAQRCPPSMMTLQYWQLSSSWLVLCQSISIIKYLPSTSLEIQNPRNTTYPRNHPPANDPKAIMNPPPKPQPAMIFKQRCPRCAQLLTINVYAGGHRSSHLGPWTKQELKGLERAIPFPITHSHCPMRDPASHSPPPKPRTIKAKMEHLMKRCVAKVWGRPRHERPRGSLASQMEVWNGREAWWTLSDDGDVPVEARLRTEGEGRGRV